jgi:hypothetical protein
MVGELPERAGRAVAKMIRPRRCVMEGNRVVLEGGEQRRGA